MANLGDSWTFILLFRAVLMGWVVLNVALLARGNAVIDPYQFIMLSLFLWMLAEVQLPIVLMLQTIRLIRADCIRSTTMRSTGRPN